MSGVKKEDALLIDHFSFEVSPIIKKILAGGAIITLPPTLYFLLNYAIYGYQLEYRKILGVGAISFNENFWLFYAEHPFLLICVISISFYIVLSPYNYFVMLSVLNRPNNTSNKSNENLIAVAFLTTPLLLTLIVGGGYHEVFNKTSMLYTLGMVFNMTGVFVVYSTITKVPLITLKKFRLIALSIFLWLIPLSVLGGVFFMLSSSVRYISSAQGRGDGIDILEQINSGSYLTGDRHIRLRAKSDDLYLERCEFSSGCVGLKRISKGNVAPIFFDRKEIVFYPEFKKDLLPRGKALSFGVLYEAANLHKK